MSKKNMINLVGKKGSPHSFLAEQIILIELLLDSPNKDLIFTRLTEEVFYLPQHRQIYQIAQELYFEGATINLTTIADRLSDLGILDSIGGNSFLLNLVNQAIPSGDLEKYVVILLDKYLRRSLIDVGVRIGLLGYESNSSIENLFDQAEQLLFTITHNKPKFGLAHASEVLLETFVELEKKYTYGSLSGLPSGFFDLDLLTQGFQKSDLIIIAGRPSMGKTSFALNLARNIAEGQPFPVTIFSLEMSRQQIMYRFLAIESQIVNSRLRSGDVTPEEWNLISKAINYLASLKIYLDDTPNSSLSEIRAKLTRLKSSHGQIGVVIIDYLQLLNENSYKNNRVQELSRITRNLKILAREFDTPVIALSQLSRNVESRTNKRPLLSDLRESGCLVGSSKIYFPFNQNSIALDRLSAGPNMPIFTKPSKGSQLWASYIRSIYNTGKQQTYLLKLTGNYFLQLTSGHKLLTNKGWVKLKNLQRNILIATVDQFNFPKGNKVFWNKNLVFMSILSINLGSSLKVYDLWIPTTGNFVCNNIIVHNSIEQDADLVLMLYREGYYFPSVENNNITEVIIAKQRNGPIGTINLIFDPKLASFSNFVLID